MGSGMSIDLLSERLTYADFSLCIPLCHIGGSESADYGREVTERVNLTLPQLDPQPTYCAVGEEHSLVGTWWLFAKGWKRLVKPGAPGPLLQEALVVVKRIGCRAIARRR